MKARPCTHVQCLVSRIIAAAPGPDTAPAAAEAEYSRTGARQVWTMGFIRGILSGERRGNYHYERGPEESRYCAL